jgi:hypothetical protein
LLLDEVPKVRLSNARYAEFVLMPGMHTVAWEPGILGNAAWRSRKSFEARADTSYYLAVWDTVEGARSFAVVAPLVGAAWRAAASAASAMNW